MGDESKALFAAINAANAQADLYGIDRAGVDICAKAAIVAYLTNSGKLHEAQEVEDVVI